ncbi:hypothetical protein C0995_012322 [Termitomyces sp. Mi166|nr:hypothetical protein C0995_012322 [Termitomyces sp. Mi166\
MFSTQVCPHFETQKTPTEAEASAHQKAAAAAKKTGKMESSKPVKKGKAAETSCKSKNFRLDISKIHSIVHYPDSIQHFGTTDSYLTQIAQIAQQEWCGAHSRAMEQAIQETIEDEELPPTDPEKHHYISKTRQTPLNLLKWVKDHANDPAIKLNESGQEFQQMEFLWGQWYGLDDDAKSGFAAKRCYQIDFFKGEDAFGFVNPADILCAVHLIP